MDYTLNNKRRVICLVMQWAAVHGDHLQDEEEPVAFLQVRQDSTHQLHQLVPYFPFWCYGSLSDLELVYAGLCIDE